MAPTPSQACSQRVRENVQPAPSNVEAHNAHAPPLARVRNATVAQDVLSIVEGMRVPCAAQTSAAARVYLAIQEQKRRAHDTACAHRNAMTGPTDAVQSNRLASVRKPDASLIGDVRLYKLSNDSGPCRGLGGTASKRLHRDRPLLRAPQSSGQARMAISEA